jgi:hypothetical protein
LILAYSRLILFIAIIIFLISCDQDNPTNPKDFTPVLSDLAVPDTILTNIDQSYIFTVNCKDENGLDDIDSVVFKILSNHGQLIVSGIMFDDGNYETHGDNVPHNGKYSVRLKFDLTQGDYRFVAQAVDKTKLRSEELSDTFHTMPGIINLAPVIMKFHIPDTVYVDQIIPFYLSVAAADPDSLDFIKKVSYQILEPSLTDIAEQGELNDQGLSGDSLAGDGIYSIETSTAFANWKFGNYHLMIQAFDSHNKASENIYVILPWAKTKIGEAPKIISVSAPVTIQLPSSGDKNFVLTATITDQDDNRDIKEVFFKPFKPDGSPASLDSLSMSDDGTSGDAIAGDYIYSLGIFISSTNDTGNYRFEFQAKDYSELLSDKVIHIITVIK